MSRKIKRIFLAICLVLLAAAIGGAAYYYAHYYKYDRYKLYTQGYLLPEGTEFSPLPDSGRGVEGFSLAAESEQIGLYINEKTAETAVLDKRNGHVTYSNPQDADKDAVAVSKDNRNIMKSQLIVYYLDSNNNTVTKGFDSYGLSVANDQFTINSIPDGVQVVYTLGNFESKTGIVPTFLTEERFQELCGMMDEKNQKEMNNRYAQDEENPGVRKLRGTGASTVRKVKNVLETVGYTQNDYVADMAAAGVDIEPPISFEVTLNYTVKDDSIRVSIPTKNLKESGGAKISRIDLMSFFDAGSGTEDGYLFVPNGSGSIINFNNGKIKTANYSQYVYGMDPLLSSNSTTTENTLDAMLPVFGIVKDSSATLAIIEGGEALASVTAQEGGNTTSYNHVYSSFMLRNWEEIKMDGGRMTVVMPDFYNTEPAVRYCFLSGEDGYSYSYAGLANYYRDYLLANEGIRSFDREAAKAAGPEDIPFYMDVLGGVKETKFFLGTQYLNVTPMTTFREASDMTDTMSSLGVNNVVMDYKGWFNGGYYHDVPDKVRLVHKLGSKDEFEELSRKLEANGGKLYADVSFQEVTSISKRYLQTTETSRYFGSGHVAVMGKVNPATLRNSTGLGYRECQYSLISPKYLDRYTIPFADEIAGYGVTGIGLRDLADTLHSDNKRTEIINRQEALDVVEFQLDYLDKNSGKQILAEAPNVYGLKVADDATGIPGKDNDFFLIDEEVPFYQMVIHGVIDYAADAVNISADYDRDDVVLACIATGASPRFVFTKKEASEMKYTGLNDFYSTTFDNWSDESAGIYREVNDVLKYVSNATVTDHIIYRTGVTETVYSNGVRILVNRTDRDYCENGVEIGAGQYRAEGVE